MKEYDLLCRNYTSLVDENGKLKQKREMEERENAEIAVTKKRELEQARRANQANKRRQKIEIDSLRAKLELKESENNALLGIIEGQLNKDPF